MEFAKKFQLDQAMTGVAPVFELQTHVPKAVDIEHNAMQQQGCFQEKKWKTKIKKANGIEPQGHRMKIIHIYPVYVSVDRERERDQKKGTVSIDKDAEKGKMCVEAFPSAHILRFEHISLFLSYSILRAHSRWTLHR